jgi:hypothetical protein
VTGDERAHLTPNGVLAFHVTKRFLSLAPVFGRI